MRVGLAPKIQRPGHGTARSGASPHGHGPTDDLSSCRRPRRAQRAVQTSGSSGPRGLREHPGRPGMQVRPRDAMVVSYLLIDPPVYLNVYDVHRQRELYLPSYLPCRPEAIAVQLSIPMQCACYIFVISIGRDNCSWPDSWKFTGSEAFPALSQTCANTPACSWRQAGRNVWLRPPGSQAAVEVAQGQPVRMPAINISTVSTEIAVSADGSAETLHHRLTVLTGTGGLKDVPETISLHSLACEIPYSTTDEGIQQLLPMGLGRSLVSGGASLQSTVTPTST